jgi:hypothetical protein
MATPPSKGGETYKPEFQPINKRSYINNLLVKPAVNWTSPLLMPYCFVMHLVNIEEI